MPATKPVGTHEELQKMQSDIRSLSKSINKLYEMSDSDLMWEHIRNGDCAKQEELGHPPYHTATEYRALKTQEYTCAISDTVRAIMSKVTA